MKFSLIKVLLLLDNLPWRRKAAEGLFPKGISAPPSQQRRATSL